MIDTVKQVAFLEDDMRIRYRDVVKEFLETHAAGGHVSRRELASVIGKLQWAAQVVPGGQLKLTRCYWSRYLFCDTKLAHVHSAKEKWGKGVDVVFTSKAREDLQWWLHVLDKPTNTKIYLSRHPLTSGFWKGLIREDDLTLDRQSETEEGIIVFTTDAASGYALRWRCVVEEPPHLQSLLSAGWSEVPFVQLA